MKGMALLPTLGCLYGGTWEALGWYPTCCQPRRPQVSQGAGVTVASPPVDSPVVCECHSSSTWFLCVGSGFEMFLSMKGSDAIPPKPCFIHFPLRQQIWSRKAHKNCFQIFLLVLQPLNLYAFSCTFLHQNRSLIENDIDWFGLRQKLIKTYESEEIPK